jgi:hypothetical protein
MQGSPRTVGQLLLNGHLLQRRGEIVQRELQLPGSADRRGPPDDVRIPTGTLEPQSPFTEAVRVAPEHEFVGSSFLRIA